MASYALCALSGVPAGSAQQIKDERYDPGNRRILVHGDVVPDLAGIENIQIDSQRQVKG